MLLCVLFSILLMLNEFPGGEMASNESGMPRLSGGLVKHLANQVTANEELALAA